MLDNAMMQSEQKTLERFNRSQDRKARYQGYGVTEGALAVTREYAKELSPVIAYQLQQLSNSRSNLKTFGYVVRNLDPDVLAVATLQATLHSVATEATLRATCTAIGYTVRGECWAAGLLAHSPKLYARVTRAAKRKHSDIRYRQQAARSLAARDSYRTPEWPKRDVVAAGGFLLNCVLKALPDVFQQVTVNDTNYVLISDGALELAEEAVEQAVRANPVFVPCVQPPQPWTGLRRGGYWDERTRLSAPVVRAYHKDTIAAIKASMRSGAMQPHVDAINSLQNVAWTINEPVLEIVKWAYEHGVDVEGLPRAEDIEEPARLSEEEWSVQANRRLQRYKISQVKEANRSLVSERVLFTQDMAIAAELVSQPAFYTPVNSDWRGRVYSVPHFNYQRDDRVRALFLFANGMPIGEEGLYWLKVHVANCGDFDKISKRPFEERVAWTDSHLGMIQAIARNPQYHVDYWKVADKPFLFLAACMELASALACGPTYVTRLPVSFDGSCSGLQHLCAMTRAAEGSLVNLTPQELPQDVYQTVADLVNSRISADVTSATASPEQSSLARLCLDFGIDRKLVKRNVMTYSYSSRKFGMSQQHMEDLMKPLVLDVLMGKYDKHPFGDDAGLAASKYLASHIYAAIESVVNLPAQAMAFLQKLARALAHEGKPLSWTTPSGLPWINRYHEPAMTSVELWLSDTRVQVKIADGHKKKIDKDKAANGVAPNFVHALDASHLALTVNACVREGITNIATVHDSFGCLAPQAVRFNGIIREQFVQMYEQHDVLAEVLETAKRDLTVHNWERLPEVPVKGPLDLKEVLNAQFAFA